jgi:hypothetical protein
MTKKVFYSFRSIIKKRLLAKPLLSTVLAAVFIVGGFQLATASADTITWTGNGTSNGLCSDVSSDPNVTGQEWLFILTSPGPGPWTLTTSFSPSAQSPANPIAGVQQGGGSIHFTVDTAIGAKLLSASATNGTENSNLTVSHCTVGRGTSTTATTLHTAAEAVIATGGSVPLGTVMHDLATVTPSGTTAPTGNVSFTFYNNDSCDGDGTAAGTVALNGANPGVAHPSDSTAALAAGSYAFQANWPGDTNYFGSTSDCEHFTVNKAQLHVTTEAHDASHNDITNGSVALGSVTHDTAAVTGGVNGFALPAVSFTLTGNYTVANDGIDAGNGALKSADSAPLGAGHYAYQASVAGNDNYIGASSDCEPYTVNKGTLTLTTDIHDVNHNVITAIDAGGTVHDQANVSGINANFAPANSVAFTFYRNGNCTTGTPESAGSQAIVNGIAHPSDSEGPLNAGSYAFQAAYDGTNDPNYNSVTSDCEPLAVNKVTPGITTTPNPGNGTVGVTLNDSAALSGGFNLTGTITFKLYSPSDSTCANTPAFTNVVNVNGASTYNTSAGFASNAAGTWRWVAVYSGDGNNNSVMSGCNDEQVTIASPVTRTLGFWQTHFQFTSGVFNASAGNPIWTICSPNGRTITNTNVLFGGFYASIPKTTTGAKRSSLDQARMQLMQQLLAAILNNVAFGSGNTTTLNTAKAAYCGTNQAAILNQVSVLDAFNSSGDSQSTTQNTGSANPKASSNAANLTAWDVLP